MAEVLLTTAACQPSLVFFFFLKTLRPELEPQDQDLIPLGIEYGSDRLRAY